MQQIPQIEPISRMARDHKTLLQLTNKGPVYLTQRSEAVAVMISAKQWNETAQLLEELQVQLNQEKQLRLSNQRYAAMQIDPSRSVSQEEYERLLADAGLTV